MIARRLAPPLMMSSFGSCSGGRTRRGTGPGGGDTRAARDKAEPSYPMTARDTQGDRNRRLH